MLKKMTRTILTIILLFSNLTIFGQTNKDLNIHFKLRGHIYAKSSIEDTSAAGGFGDSDNLPKKISDTLNFTDKGLIIRIDTTRLTTISGKYNAYNLFICNNSDAIARFDASDSRLNVVAEVFYKGEWKLIEYLPNSSCGNSYHNVYLKANEYWTFEIPKFTGSIKTKLRYILIMGKDKFIYSNEILTSINKGQFINKEGYRRIGLMDPYNE